MRKRMQENEDYETARWKEREQAQEAVTTLLATLKSARKKSLVLVVKRFKWQYLLGKLRYKKKALSEEAGIAIGMFDGSWLENLARYVCLPLKETMTRQAAC